MSMLFNMMRDAVFATPETYRRRYVTPAKKSFACIEEAREKTDKEGELENRLFISGGKWSPRMRVLCGAIDQQLKAGRAVVVIQPANMTSDTIGSQFSFESLSPMDGSYDPFYDYSTDDVVEMLIADATAEGFSKAEAADLTQALDDEIGYLSASENELCIGNFVNTSSRKIGEIAFGQGNVQLAESHAQYTINARIDKLRLALRKRCNFSSVGKSIAASAKPGTMTVLKLPGNSPSWMASVLYELNYLQDKGKADVLPVFLEMHISETCRSMLEGLPGGRYFCYQDLPSMGWLWNVATAASPAGCLLKHIGTSAQIISDCFGKQRVEKVVRTRSSSRSNCDSGGFMGIFGSTTLSSSHGCTVSYEWEPTIPDDVIRKLDDNEGIFFYQDFNMPYRIDV